MALRVDEAVNEDLLRWAKEIDGGAYRYLNLDVAIAGDGMEAGDRVIVMAP